MRYRLSPWALTLMLSLTAHAARAQDGWDPAAPAPGGWDMPAATAPAEGAAAGAEPAAPAAPAALGAAPEGGRRAPGRYRPDVSQGPALTAGSLESFRKRLRERLASTPPPAPGLRPMRGPPPGPDATRLRQTRADEKPVDGGAPADNTFAAIDPATGAPGERREPDWSSDAAPADRGFAPDPAGKTEPGMRPMPGRDDFANVPRDDLPPPPSRMPGRPGLERPLPPTFADGALGDSVVGAPPTGRPGFDRPTDGPPPRREPPPADAVSLLPYTPEDPASGRGIVPPRPPPGDVIAELPGNDAHGRDPLGIPAPVDPATGVTTITPAASDFASDAALPAPAFDRPAPAGPRQRVPPDIRARHSGSR